MKNKQPKRTWLDVAAGAVGKCRCMKAKFQGVRPRYGAAIGLPANAKHPAGRTQIAIALDEAGAVQTVSIPDPARDFFCSVETQSIPEQPPRPLLEDLVAHGVTIIAQRSANIEIYDAVPHDFLWSLPTARETWTGMRNRVVCEKGFAAEHLGGVVCWSIEIEGELK